MNNKKQYTNSSIIILYSSIYFTAWLVPIILNIAKLNFQLQTPSFEILPISQFWVLYNIFDKWEMRHQA